MPLLRPGIGVARGGGGQGEGFLGKHMQWLRLLKDAHALLLAAQHVAMERAAIQAVSSRGGAQGTAFGGLGDGVCLTGGLEYPGEEGGRAFRSEWK